MKKVIVASAVLLMMPFVGMCADAVATPKTTSTAQASVYIVSPKNGDKVKSPVTVVFGLKGMGVAPAGVEKLNTGHHHLLVDADELPPSAKPIPADAHHVHFGGGQTQVDLELTPGVHSLQLLLGDHLHIPHDPVVSSEKILITVE